MLTECDVILAEVPTEKESSIVKIIYRLLNINAKDAKNLIKSVPVSVMQGVSTEKAKTFQQELEQAGAKVNIRKAASLKSEEMSQPLDAFELDVTALEQYYSALAKVESKYQELLEVQKEFRWYESKLQEADKLAAQLDIQKPSKLSVQTFKGSNLLTRKVVELAISKAHNKVAEHENVQKLLHETISRLQKEFNEHMSALRKERDETISNLQNEINLNLSNLKYHLDNFDHQITNNLKKVDQLKTKRMVEIVLIVLAGISSVLVIQNIIVVVISMLIVWAIRTSMD